MESSEPTTIEAWLDNVWNCLEENESYKQMGHKREGRTQSVVHQENKDESQRPLVHLIDRQGRDETGDSGLKGSTVFDEDIRNDHKTATEGYESDGTVFEDVDTDLENREIKFSMVFHMYLDPLCFKELQSKYFPSREMSGETVTPEDPGDIQGSADHWSTEGNGEFNEVSASYIGRRA